MDGAADGVESGGEVTGGCRGVPCARYGEGESACDGESGAEGSRERGGMQRIRDPLWPVGFDSPESGVRQAPTGFRS